MELFALQGNRVYMDEAPEEDSSNPTTRPVYPLTIFHHVTGHDSIYGGGIRAQTDNLYFVRAICEGPARGVKKIADRIDYLLNFSTPITQRVGTDNYTILGCYRERPASGAGYETGGVRYSWKGGYYRIYINGT